MIREHVRPAKYESPPLDGWDIKRVAAYLGLKVGSLYVWSCTDAWGGNHPPAPKRVCNRLVWDPAEIIDYRNRQCAKTRKQVVYGG
ncbi:helix-turn-helix domain-containing protein [Bifidobacterium imperatoris]|nr:helix-turn-helix domain-containing protein [Bifidobacterium imperatoris]QSY58909.1 helix-turn-helix domain-containing protein [Bifidobacterium imperatoris]